jgi:hypothetical protein
MKDIRNEIEHHLEYIENLKYDIIDKELEILEKICESLYPNNKKVENIITAHFYINGDKRINYLIYRFNVMKLENSKKLIQELVQEYEKKFNTKNNNCIL